MTWHNTTPNPEDYVGFVYLITEISTGKQYVGIKKYWKKTRKKQPKYTKNKKGERVLNKLKRKITNITESDWRTYNTSSPIMQKKLETNPENYTKTIIRHCKTVTDMKCYEAHYQLTMYFDGKWEDLYNEVIHLRLRIRKED